MFICVIVRARSRVMYCMGKGMILTLHYYVENVGTLL